jgi:hypothetical protein
MNKIFFCKYCETIITYEIKETDKKYELNSKIYKQCICSQGYMIEIDAYQYNVLKTGIEI